MAHSRQQLIADSLDTESGFSRLFCAYASGIVPESDDYGFTLRTSGLLTIRHLLQHRSILVRARPWLGKSFVARRIRDQRQHLNLPDYVDLTQLSELSGALRLPEWWNAWLQGEQQACWIIDSLDEGENLCPNISYRLIEQIEGLTESQRSRLQLIVFCREAVTPAEFVSRLSNLYADEFIQAELLPLDQDSARRFDLKRPVDEVFARIELHNLAAIAGLPAALETIATMEEHELVNGENAVWKHVLLELLREQDSKRLQRERASIEVEHLFAAAAQVAITMTFSGSDEIAEIGQGNGSTTLEQHIGVSALPNAVTRQHARQVLRSTMFSRGRFAQSNFREWMCAFGLSAFALRKIIPLLTKGDGSLIGRHSGVLALLGKIGNDDVRDWICEKNGGFMPSPDCSCTIEEVRSFLDRLLDISRNVSGHVYVVENESLKNLRHPRLGKELTGRLELPTITDPQIEVLLDVAINTGARDVLPIAHSLALDNKRRKSVRVMSASCVLVYGGNDDVRTLLEELRRRRSAGDSTILSATIRESLKRKLLTVEEAIAFAPMPDERTIDVTTILYDELLESLTLRAAATFVKRMLRRLRPNSTPSRPIPDQSCRLLMAAIELIVTQPTIEASMEGLLLRLVMSFDSEREKSTVWWQIEALLPKSTSLRRAMYLAGFRPRTSPKEGGREHGWLLNSDDLEWLQERVIELADIDVDAWHDFLTIADGSDSNRKRKARRFARSVVPEVVQRHEANAKQMLAEYKRRELKRRSEEKKREHVPVTIADIVKSILNSKRGLHEKMLDLSWICFCGESFRPVNVIGTWSDLAESDRTLVLDTCQNALETTSPTAIPDGSSFPSSLIYEAHCFHRMIVERPDTFAPSATMVSKWLPSVSFLDSQISDTITAHCFEVAPNAVEGVLLDRVLRDLRCASAYMFSVAHLTAELWTQRLIEFCCDQVRNPLYSGTSRAVLLRILVKHARAHVGSLIRDISADADEQMRAAAIDGLMAIDPATGMLHFRREYAERGVKFVKDLPHLRYLERNRIDLYAPEWTASLLEELYRILRHEFPPKPSDREGGRVTIEMELANVRASIPPLLRTRQLDGDQEALEALAKDFPDIREWIEHDTAQSRLAAEVKSLAKETDLIPLGRLVRMIENPDYRIIRNDDDLLDVIEDTLNMIGTTAPNHLEMLYLPTDDESKRRRDEAALQAYVHCRLHDLLPSRILDVGTQVDINREPQVGRRRRFDVKVTAPQLNGAKATVVIEIKWSDNKDADHNVSTALTKQLGDKYLKDEGLTHGIYLVGWNGKLGAWQATTRPSSPTCEALTKCLNQQAARYCIKTGLAIRVVMFDLHYPEESNKKRKPVTKRPGADA